MDGSVMKSVIVHLADEQFRGEWIASSPSPRCVDRRSIFAR